MFPNCQEVRNMSQSATKLKYLISDALAPYFEEDLINDIQGNFNYILLKT